MKRSSFIASLIAFLGLLCFKRTKADASYPTEPQGWEYPHITNHPGFEFMAKRFEWNDRTLSFPEYLSDGLKNPLHGIKSYTQVMPDIQEVDAWMIAPPTLVQMGNRSANLRARKVRAICADEFDRFT